jgi:hypothetical protein
VAAIVSAMHFKMVSRVFFLQREKLEQQHLSTLSKEWEKREKEREAQVALV